jgi:alkylated DNA repair dioxygenase AlkB
VRAATTQRNLFETEPELPEGMRYVRELIAPVQERALLAELPALPFKEFEFHGFLGKRRVVSFGWRYGFDGSGLNKADDIPAFLLPVRQRAADFAGLPASALEHALVIEYGPGAAIGWRRDRPVFGDVVGISLLSPCTFRLRRKRDAKWERRSFTAEPRSAYLAVPRAANGSTASRRSTRCAIPSRSAALRQRRSERDFASVRAGRGRSRPVRL